MTKRVIAAFMAAVMLLCLTGCGAAAPVDNSTTHTITDLLGRQVEIPNEIDKIAAIAGPTYEMVFMLGSADQVVMVKSGHTDSYPLANLTNPKLIEMDGIAANPSSFVRMGELVPVEVVHVSEGLPTHLTCVVLLDRLTGFLDRLGHGHSCAAGAAAGVGARGRCSDCGQDACDG